MPTMKSFASFLNSPSSSPLLTLLLFVLFSFLPLVVLSHYSSPSLADFTIHSVANSIVTVTLPDRRTRSPLAECTFTYRTSELGTRKPIEPTPVTAAPTQQAVDVLAVAKQLEGACITSTSDYWTYEYCFGRHLKQYHGGDVYWLARQSVGDQPTRQPDGKSFLLTGGDMCAALQPPAPRQVKVNWACKKNAQTPQIVSIAETSTCSYQIQVGSALVCSDPSFPILADNYISSPVASGPLDTGSEDWYIELVELETVTASGDETNEPILMCQAYSLEYRATSVKNLRFAEFELKITKLQGDPNVHRSDVGQLPKEYQHPIARRASRVPVPRSELDINYGHIALKKAPSNPDTDYDGELSFVKVYA